MYLRFGPTGPDDFFSYILCKNPTSPPFVRELNDTDGARRVTGKFVGHEYEVIVENDPLRIMEVLRNENRPFYVTERGVAVTPYNLAAAQDALDSAIKGKNGKIDPAVFFEPKSMRAILGPFVAPRDRLLAQYKDLGLNPEVEASMSGVSATTVSLSATDMSVTQFLQRMFVGAYTLRGPEDKFLDEGQVRSLMDRCKDWLNDVAGRERLIRKLTGYRTKLTAEFKEKVAFEAEVFEEDGEKKIGLHQKRHAAIMAALESIPAPSRIVDLGCGDGGLTKLLCEKYDRASVLAIDGDEYSLHRLRQKVNRPLKTMLASVTMPFLEQEDLEPDVLVLCEVIEHLIATDRRILIDHIRRMWQPKTLVLTTPNIAYNAVWGMPAGKLRHRDHVVEYTDAQCWSEVIAPLSDLYEFECLPLLPESDLQPSFVIVGTRRRRHEQDLRPLHVARSMVSPYSLEEMGYTVSADEVRTGVRMNPYRHHREEIFYLSPTMAPVEWSEEHPDVLEHPATAFRYYRERGVDRVIVEHKYMGSRGHVALFRSPQHAERAGFSSQMTVISRGGYPFFSKSDAEERATLEELTAALTKTQWLVDEDFILFDAEVMPWKTKATGLIDRSFRMPGEAMDLDRAYKGEPRETTKAFLAALDTFAQDGPVTFRPFGVLAYGQISDAGYFNVKIGSQMEHTAQLRVLDRLFKDVSCVKPIERLIVNLGDAFEVQYATARWGDYTACGGEGVVVKPMDPRSALPDGVLVQPALKVRGKEYLRLIYGPDYTEKRYLEKLRRRNVKAKRRTALIENALGERILKSHLRRMEFAKNRAIAAFLGVDGVAAEQLDRTL